MKQTVHKIFWVWEFEEEEQWLNEMAAKGLHLTDVGFGRYVFQEGEPGAYRYRLEMMEHWPNHPESKKYLEFMEETGAEFVGSFKNWVYFRKKREAAPFDLYSDIDSRIKHLDRITRLLKVLSELLAAVLVLYVVGALREGGVFLAMLFPMALVEAGIVRGLKKIRRKLDELQNERMIRE